MADSKTATVSAADLAFLDEAVKAVATVRRPVKPGATRERQPNPFEATLKASWETAWTDESGERHEHGEPRQTGALTANQRDIVIRALVRAGRHLSYSVPREVVPATDENGRRVPGKFFVVYAAAELKRRKRNGKNGDQADEQAPGLWEGDHQHGDYPEHSHPATNPEHAHAKQEDGDAGEPAVIEQDGDQGEQDSEQSEQSADDQQREPAWG